MEYIRQKNKRYVPVGFVMEVRNSQSLVSKHKGNRKSTTRGRGRARLRWKERETPTEWDFFLKKNLCNPHLLRKGCIVAPLKTAKEACMMFSVPNLIAWTQLKHQTLHHTPTLTLMNLHKRHIDTGQKNHYGGKAATISSMHHLPGQVNTATIKINPK